MPEYVYRAITKEGVIVKNRVDSPSKQNLIRKLKMVIYFQQMLFKQDMEQKKEELEIEKMLQIQIK